LGYCAQPLRPRRLNVRAGLAQLVERLICNQDVTSSNLVAGTIFS
jgi:hypothetical protein